jgi:hypothetical protein
VDIKELWRGWTWPNHMHVRKYHNKTLCFAYANKNKLL